MKESIFEIGDVVNEGDTGVFKGRGEVVGLFKEPDGTTFYQFKLESGSLVNYHESCFIDE